MHLDAEQCRERAKLVRYTAEAVKSALLRQDLLEVANEYEGCSAPVDRLVAL